MKQIITDPTQIDWGNEKEEPQPPPTTAAPVANITSPVVQTFKCTALYSYTVSLLIELLLRFIMFI